MGGDITVKGDGTPRLVLTWRSRTFLLGDEQVPESHFLVSCPTDPGEWVYVAGDLDALAGRNDVRPDHVVEEK